MTASHESTLGESSMPGPWSVDVGMTTFEVFSDDGRVIARIPRDYRSPEANKHLELIKFAPVLLAVAQRIEARIAYYASMAELDQPNIEQWAYTDGSGDIAALRAVIAQCKGETK